MTRRTWLAAALAITGIIVLWLIFQSWRQHSWVLWFHGAMSWC